MKHYALIPAKEKSSRCLNKNWKDFIGRDSLVKYLVRSIPKDIFDLVILSTDKTGLRSLGKTIIHNRPKRTAQKASPVNDLISLVVSEYGLPDAGYIWLLNPTSPLRNKSDFLKIRRIIEDKKPSSVISVTRMNPYIWKDNTPLFDTGYPRKNTQDFKMQYSIENGQFIVFRIGDFLRTRSWYFDSTIIFRQEGLKSIVDIDTEDDFLQAQKLCTD